jgi:hypothetical protein
MCKLPRTRKQPETKIGRQVVLVEAASPGQPWAAVQITSGKDTALYAVKPIRSDIGGRGFEVVKQGEVEAGESGYYHVLVDGPANSYCSCRGCERLVAPWRSIFRTSRSHWPRLVPSARYAEGAQVSEKRDTSRY